MIKTNLYDKGIILPKYVSLFFNQVVEFLFKLLEKEVSKFSPYNLVEIIYSDLEETLYKIKITEVRYASDILCYPESHKDSLKTVNELNKLSIALKFLIEYVSAQPPKGEEVLGIGNYEYILAICSTLIEWAYKNDLYYYEIFNTPIRILNSGRIGFNRESFEKLYDITEKFRNEQMFLNSLGSKKKTLDIDKEKYIAKLDEAFLSCFGYSFKQFYLFIFKMIELSKESGGIICVMKKEQILSYFSSIPDLSGGIIEKILDNISLKERDSYLVKPVEEVYPWRFNRKYSFLRRPVIIRNDDYIWGNKNLYHTYLYTIDLIFKGKLKTENTIMQKLIGTISNERGKLFNESVVEYLKTIKEFNVYENVKKINRKKIEFVRGQALGDIAVLIIDKEKSVIYVAEVKQFNFSRNPYEMHQEYSKMFVDTDKKKCFATKHSLRVKWIKENIEELKNYYSLIGNSWKVIGLFIVDDLLVSTRAYNQSINVITYEELSLSNIRKFKK